jgi:transposase
MKKITVWIGLDYHFAHVQACVMDRAGRVLVNAAAPNDWRAISVRVRREWCVKGVSIEACSGAADMADELIGQLGWPVTLPHPGTAARMKRNPDKSDYSDARILADLIRVGYAEALWLPPSQVRDLRLVTRYRQQLVRERRDIKLRIGAILREQRVMALPERRWSLPWLAAIKTGAGISPEGRWVIERQFGRLAQLNQAIAQAERHMAEITVEDAMVQKLLADKGVGLITARVMRAELGGIERFGSGKKLARYCGLSPRNASSGKKQADAGLIRAANGDLRTAIIETAHRLGRLEPRWKRLKDSLRARGRSGSVAAAAIANRWMRKLYHDLKAQPEAA